MTANPRIEELRRRVKADPTSIAFAALAEEYRRAGQYEEAIEVCRNGLTRHPAYISARVTLGRTLIELNRLDEAEAELTQVLKIAPENLAAIRAQAEIHTRKGPRRQAPDPEPPEAPDHPSGSFELDLIGTLPEPPRPTAALPTVETLQAVETVPTVETVPAVEAPSLDETGPAGAQASLAALEQFLNGILARKARRLTTQI